MLYPHISRVRSVARMAVYDAVVAEDGGDIARGVGIRMAVMRCGRLLRVNSSSRIGSLVGIAIPAIAENRPGGVPSVTKPTGTPSQQWTAHKRGVFLEYLRRSGHASDADWATGEFTNDVRAKDIMRHTAPIQIKSSIDLSLAQLAGMVLLTDFFWFVVVALVATLLIGVRRQWPTALALLVVSLVGLTTVALSMAQWGEAVKAIWEITSDLSGTVYPGGAPLLFACQEIPIATLAPPAIGGIAVLTMYALAGQKPPIRLIARHAPGAALFVLLIYVLLMVPTVRMEARENYVLEQTLTHEGKFIANQLHRPLARLIFSGTLGSARQVAP